MKTILRFASCALLALSLASPALHAQTFQIDAVKDASATVTASFCGDATGSVDYSVSAPFGTAQTFNVELSDNTGTFAAVPPILGTVSSTVGGNISITIPSIATTSASYKIRIANATAATLSTNTSTLTLNARPTISLSSPLVPTTCMNVDVTYTTDAAMTNYVWSVPGTLGVDYTVTSGSLASTSNSVTLKWTTVGSKTVTVNYTDASGCTAVVDGSNTITVNPNVGTPVFALGAASAPCQNSGIVSYTATATNTTGITYTLATAPSDPTTTINGATGDVSYSAGFAGIATITAHAAGCGTTTTADHVATITPSVGNPVFALGATSNRCQGAGNVTYSATATNSTSIAYSLDATSTGAGNSINTSTGQVAYVAGYFGTSVITATAAGCNGPTVAIHTVTITPTVGNPVFALGATSNRCQGAGNVTYSATATNSTSIAYSLDATSTGAGNSINTSTGQVTYLAGYSGTSVITATAAGCNGPTVAIHTVTITPTVGSPVFASGATSVRCQGAGNVTYSATATNSTSIAYSLDATSTGAGNSINTSTGQVTYLAGYSGTSVITATAAGCNGPKSSIHTVTITPTVGNPVFALGATSNRCQGANIVVYSATATNNTGITYSLDASSLAGGNTINSFTGAVNYDANWNGTSIITATATGCNGPKSSIHTVTIVGKPVFTIGATSVRCQGYSILTYTATSVNSSTISYSFVTAPAASSMNTALGIVAWDPAFSGTAAIRATETGCGLSSDHTVTVTAGVGPTSFVGASSTACQGSTVIYLATAVANTGITYSISTTPSSATTINSITGQVNYDPAFLGTATITAVATGCGPSTSAGQSVVIKPVVTTPVFNAGPSSTICQNPGAITYTATAANTIVPLAYSISNPAAGTISPTTGQVNYNSGFTGPVSITALATGCAGSDSAKFNVSVTPSVGVPAFDSATTSTRKQGSDIKLYRARVTNGALTYSLNPASAGSIRVDSGIVTFNPLFSGLATITAVASGCNTTAASTITHLVTVVQTPVFALGSTTTRCQGANSITYTASSNGTVSYSLKTVPASAATINSTTGQVNYPSNFSGTATISATAILNGVVTDTSKHIVIVNIAPRLTTPTPTTKTICSGDTSLISLVATTGANSSFTWTVAGGAGITGSAIGNISVINQTLVNISNAHADSLYYVVTATSPAPASCPSVILDSIKVVVNPKPTLAAIATNPICSQSSINISLGASTPSTFSWAINPAPKVIGASSGSGNLINQTLINTDSSATPTSGSVAYLISTTSLLGCKGALDSGVVNVLPAPRVTFGTGNSVVTCSGTPLAINLSANIASNFAYTTGSTTSLGLISGNAASVGNPTAITDNLINSSNALQDTVYYTVTPTTSDAKQCIGIPKTVLVTVNPKPKMTAAITDSVCSQSVTNTKLSATLPSTFSWTTGPNTGGILGQTSSTGSVAVTSINEPLTNPSFTTAGTVQYVVTPTTISTPNCVGLPVTITVKVNPLPKLLSDTTQTICSDSVLDYIVTSSTGASSVYTYKRTSNSLNIPSKDADTTFAVTDHLINFLSSNHVYIPRNVDYMINLKSASGCVFNNQKVSVSVSPTPSEPGISIAPPSNLCLNVLGQNFGAGRNQDPSERFVWSGPVVQQRNDSTFYALISFPSAGTQFVKVSSHVLGFQCNSVVTTKAFNVGTAGASNNPNVVFFAQNLVCQAPNVSKYQWGFDSRASLDSTIITGATTQNLFVGSGSNFDPTNNFYWVMATFADGCVRKAYFNTPTTAITPVKTFSGVPVKVYPNPVSDVFTVELPNTTISSLTIEIFDLSGRRLQTTHSTTAKTEISAKELLPGYYVVVCSQNGERLATTRFIKQ